MFEKYLWKCVWNGNDCQRCMEIKQFLENNNVKTVCNTINLSNSFERTRTLSDSGDNILKKMYRYEVLVSGKDYKKAKRLVHSYTVF